MNLCLWSVWITKVPYQIFVNFLLFFISTFISGILVEPFKRDNNLFSFFNISGAYNLFSSVLPISYFVRPGSPWCQCLPSWSKWTFSQNINNPPLKKKAANLPTQTHGTIFTLPEFKFYVKLSSLKEVKENLAFPEFLCSPVYKNIWKLSFSRRHCSEIVS